MALRADHVGGGSALTGAGAALAVGESTWSAVAAPSTNDFRGVSMPTESTVYAVETDRIWKSTDAGVTWEKMWEAATGPATFSVRLNDVEFADAMNGWAVGYYYSTFTMSGEARVLHTTDGGENWTVEPVENTPDKELHAVAVRGVDQAIAAGDDDLVTWTFDGGATWTDGTTFTGEDYRGVSWYADDEWVAVGTNGQISRVSVSPTPPWTFWDETEVHTTETLHGVDFWDGNDGVIVGEGMFFLKTTDGGANWSREDLFSGSLFTFIHAWNDVRCVEGDEAYAVGYFDSLVDDSLDGANVMVITDRGADGLTDREFPEITGDPDGVLWAADYASAGEGYAAGASGTMVKLATTEVDRLAGPDRYATARAISSATWPDGTADTAVLATGGDFPDALSASGLAGALDAPLLLVGTEVTSALTDELGRLGVTDVYLVGGTGVISLDAEEALADDYTVTRVWGADRYETAAEVAREIESVTGASFTADAFVARGDEFPDALAVAPFAYSQAMPVLLTRPDALPAQTEAVMTDLAVDAAWVAGGTGAVTSPVKDTVDTILNDNGGPSSIRWGGADRYATAADIAGGGISQGWAGTSYIGVATGSDFPDALAGGAACGAMSGSMVLTPSDSLPANVASFISSNAGFDTDVVIYGGEGVVEPDVMSAIEALY